MRTFPPILVLLSFALVALMPLFATAQDDKPKEEIRKEIKLVQAGSLEVDEPSGVKARKLIGDVIFKHEGALMFCDSAYFYYDNTLKAWGDVKIIQGDSLRLFGDSLYYNGNTRKAEMRGDLLLINKDIRLTTNYLDYDRNTDMAYYLGGGKIVNRKENNTLTSNIGYFFTKSNQFFFKDGVKLDNPDYSIVSDTLMYTTDSEVTHFFGPSTIESDNNTIYCENGWYDTKSNRSQFSRNARIASKGSLILGDSIYYDRAIGIGKAFNNVMVVDSAQDLVLKGDYTIYNEKDSTSLITGRTEMRQLFNQDSLYLHADSLFAGWDSTGKHRMLFAWYHVKFFKYDMQGKCDSLVFSDADSMITMFRDPVIWSEENQITADSIAIRNYDGKIHWMKMNRSAFIASAEPGPEGTSDSLVYNQISGKNMIGHFRKNALRRVDVTANGQTIYYAAEDNGKLIGMNRADCSEMKIYIDTNKVRRISFLNKPTAILYPLKDVTKDMKRLDNFTWLDSIRPYHPAHIFYWNTVPDSLKGLNFNRQKNLIDTITSNQKDSVSSTAPLGSPEQTNSNSGGRKGIKQQQNPAEDAPQNKGGRKGMKGRNSDQEE